jgi:transposase
VLCVEDWAEIRRLHRAEKMPIKVIARVMGHSKNTVKSALACDVAPQYERVPSGSIVDEVKPRIRELLAAWPTMPATVIAERIGWSRSIRVLSGPVAELRPVYLPPDPAGRTSYVAGEIGQHDFWFPDIELPVGFGQTRTATGVDHDHRLLPVAVRGLDPDPRRRGLVRRLVGPPRRARCGPAGAGLGWRRRDRAVARRAQRAHRRLPHVPRNARGEGADL